MNAIIKGTVVAAVAVTLLALLYVPLIDTFEPEPDDEVWEYDDYRTTEAVSSSGSLEIVTIDGTTYAHATDVGTGTLTFSDGSTETVEVDKARLDVVFMYGQSNAAYRNADTSTADPVPGLGEAYYYGLSDRYAATADENSTGMDLDDCTFWSMRDNDGELRVGSQAPSFCATYTEITGHKVYWVDGAIGNKSLSMFLPTTGFMWNYGKTVLNNAISLIDEDKFDWSLDYWMWIQGEANSGSAVDSYISQFKILNNAMLDGDMGYAFKGCFISKVRAENGVNSSVAQITLAETVPTIHMATEISDTFTVENGLMGSDDLHYSQLGNNLIGEALGEALGNAEADNTNYLDSSLITLLYTVPVFVIIGVFLMFLRIRANKDE